MAEPFWSVYWKASGKKTVIAGRAAFDRWIEFEDPEMAVLFKLRWC